MTLLPRTRRLAAVACLLVPSILPAAPVAVNDNYNVNEDAALSTAAADLLSASFEPAANVLAGGTWNYLDRAEL